MTVSTTLGQNANNASTQTNSTDRKYGSKFTPSTSGILKTGGVRAWQSTTGSSSSRLLIYSDTAGSPDVLLATSDQITINQTTETVQAYTFSGGAQITLVAGTPYWIVEHHSDPGAANFTYSRANTTNLTASSPDTYSDGAASPFGTITLSNGAIDIWVNYDEVWPKLDTISDNFDDNSIDAAWSQFNGAAESGGKVSIVLTNGVAVYKGFTRLSYYDLVASAAIIEVVNAGNQALASLEVNPITLTSAVGTGNALTFLITNGTLYASRKVANTNTNIATITWNGTTMKWLRIREASGTVYWDYSADRVSWTNLASWAYSIDVTKMVFELSAGEWQAEATTTTVELDNFNTAGAPAANTTDFFRFF